MAGTGSMRQGGDSPLKCFVAFLSFKVRTQMTPEAVMPDNKSAVRFLQSALLSLVLIATLTATANSQITRFTLTLRVTDQLGQPVAGAPVAITIEGTTQTITAVTSDDGVVVVDLDAGTYKITVSANGFAKFEESIALTSNL